MSGVRGSWLHDPGTNNFLSSSRSLRGHTTRGSGSGLLRLLIDLEVGGEGRLGLVILADCLVLCGREQPRVRLRVTPVAD